MSSTNIYDSARRPLAFFEEFLNLRRYRDLITQLVRRDIVTRYKRSVLGVAWTMLNPLGMMLVLALAFSQVFGAEKSYPVYILTGIVAWNFFAQTSVSAIRQFQWGGDLIQRIYIPKTVFAVSAVGTGLINLFLSMIPVLIVMFASNVSVKPAVLFLPVSVFLLAAFTLGIGLFLSSLAAFFWDVSEIYDIAIFAWMFLTPVIYPESIIPESRRWLFEFNPMYYLVAIFREPLYNGVLPSLFKVSMATMFSFSALFFGWAAFTSKSDEYAYRI